MIETAGLDEEVKAEKSRGPQLKPRSVQPCDFRYAGRLSNENARTLTSLHEKFALNVKTSLELYLGATLQLKLQSLEQMTIADYVSGIASNSYLVSCALNVMENNFLIDMDNKLVFPIIDLLLGGAGTALENARELTDIDEEIMQSVTALIVNQIERAWQILNLSLTPGRCIKPAMIQQVFLMNEKLVALMYEMTVGETTSSFKIVLPTSFVGFLLRHLKAAQSKKVSSFRPLRSPSLRERILDCDFVVAADITKVRVPVKELIDLKPGTMLRMTAPVNRTGRLTVEDVEIFEALPCRNGTRKAAQLTAKLQEPSAAKE
jgi:flagellar motor switch protein FliM